MPKESIQFLLNNTVMTIEPPDPNITVLDYLRNDLHLTGTKEGCASGDCGACTVVVGELHNGQVQYKTVNACISFVTTLHGRQLITVEGLKSDNQLHPAQQALLDHHGSQCGFCTPGVVMSLFCLHEQAPSPDKAQAQEALAGNLCRCTGYQPIINAALDMSASTPYQNEKTIRQLTSMAITEDISIERNGHTFHSPQSASQLAQLLLKYPAARLLAGGTDLALEVTQQHQSLAEIIYLGNITELKTITQQQGHLSIGAAATYTECQPHFSAHYPEVVNLLERLGSLQIRNQGTIGGNIGNASPIGDMLPVLIALKAKLVLQRGNIIRQINTEDFFIDYKKTALQQSEFVRAVDIPLIQKQQHLKLYKVSKRIDDDISSVLCAILIDIEDDKIISVSLAFGGMAAIPKRAVNTEAKLLNQPWSKATIESAMNTLEQDFSPLSDIRASASYRMQVARNLLLKCFTEINSPDVPSRVTGYA